MRSKTETIVFGGGCFWCTEAVFQMFDGIVRTEPGYAGGTTPNPTYKQVCTGMTGHAEVLMIEYDPGKISLAKLLGVFIEMHDPTSLNRQGADAGSQYRSAIFYSNESQRKGIAAFLKQSQERFDRPIVTEVKKLGKFYPAEEYHKDYYNRNPLQPYCAIVIGPKIHKIKKEFGLK